MRFREHRGALRDSLDTTVELADRAALVQHVTKLLRPYWRLPVVDEAIHVKHYAYDDRCGWDMYMVTLDGYGVLGFTDSPV